MLLDGLVAWNCLQHTFALDTHDAEFTLKNADMRSTAGYLGTTPTGIATVGGAGLYTKLTVEDSFVYSYWGFRPWFPPSAGATVVTPEFERTIILRNVTFDGPVNQYTRMIKMGVDYQGTATRVPATKVKIFVYKHQGDPDDNFQVFYEQQLGSATLPSESVDIPTHETFTKYGGLTHGQTNAQAWAAHSRAYGGEVIPAGAVASDGVDIEDAYLLAIEPEEEEEEPETFHGSSRLQKIALLNADGQMIEEEDLVENPDIPLTIFHVPINHPASTTVASSYTAGSGSLVVVNGSVFGSPSPSLPVRVSVDSGTTHKSILSIIGRSGNTLTVDEALEGTTDVNLSVGDTVVVRLTAGSLKDIHAAINSLETEMNQIKQVLRDNNLIG